MNTIKILSLIFLLSCTSNSIKKEDDTLKYRILYNTGEPKLDIEMSKDTIHKDITAYYKNGKVQSILHTFKDKMFGHRYYYDSLGNITSYSCYNFQGKTGYLVKYKDGRVTEETGDLIPQISVKLTESDSIKLFFPYARPPKTKIQIIVRSEKNNYIVNIGKVEASVLFPSELDEKVEIVSILRNPIDYSIISTDTIPAFNIKEAF